MGKHVGWRATQEPNGSWLGWARDPHERRYRKRRGFASKGQAAAWARDERQRLAARLSTTRRQPSQGLAERYQAHLATVMHRTPSHLANVRRCLTAWATACPDLSAADAAHVTEAWLAALPVAPATRRQYRAMIVGCAHWAVRKRIIPANPLLGIQVAPVGDRLRKQFTVADLQRMARADTDPWHLQACMLVYCGLRLGELAGIAQDDIDLGGRVLRVVGKGQGAARKERLIPIPGELADILDRIPPDVEGPLFPGDREIHAAGRHFRAFIARAGVEQPGATAHGVRHSYAGLQTAMGIPSLLLAAHMGHASLSVTAEYARLATRYRASVIGWQGEMRLR